MLNLGFENYTGRGRQLPFTYTNVMTLCDKSYALNVMVDQLNNYYEAAKNAIAIRASVRKYGRTRSMEALVGTSAINTALSFSMEGFWDTIKKAVRSVWEKIKEWALRFWHMLFSIKDRIEKTIKELKENKNDLAHDIEYEGADFGVLGTMQTAMGPFTNLMDTIYAASQADKGAEQIEAALGKVADDKFESYVTGMSITVTRKYTLKTKEEVATRLTAYLGYIDKAEKVKEPLSKAIDSVLKAIDKARDDSKNDDERETLKRKYDAYKKAGAIVSKMYAAFSSAATRDAAKVIAHIQYK